jgi:hypothetical protein
VPPGVVLHAANLSEADRTWVGPIPVTATLRTLVDCANASLSPELLEQAIEQALSRGLLSAAELAATGLHPVRHSRA